MQEVYRTNNPVIISYIEAVFDANGIEYLIADQFTSIMEGSIGAIPRRVLVMDDQTDLAEQLIKQVERDEI